MRKVSYAFVEKAKNTPVLKTRVPTNVPRHWSPLSYRFVQILSRLFPRDPEIRGAVRMGVSGLETLSRILKQKQDMYVKALGESRRFDELLLNGADLTRVLSLRCHTAVKVWPWIQKIQQQKEENDPLRTLTI